MIRVKSLVHLSLAIAVSVGSGTAVSAQQAGLPASEIVNKNVTARGGLQAWRTVQTVTMSGKMEAGGNNRPALPTPGGRRGVQAVPPRPATQVELPFKMDLKRSRKLRIELEFKGQTAVQVYDGANGWMMRPYLNRTDYEPYTAEQAKAASEQSDLDGPLVDYAAKGNAVELAGTEKVDGRDNYKLKVTLKNGYAFHVWIDARTFLETKMEGTPRRLDGQNRPVEIYMSDYRQVNGVLIPFVLETKVQWAESVPGRKQIQTAAEKITIDNVVVNPKLDDSLFSKPKSEVAANASHNMNPSGNSLRQ
jgi:outer membrane lipoprotein-sorting protein